MPEQTHLPDKSKPESPAYSPQYTENDRAAGFEILPNFQRFSQRNDVFSRSFWDSRIRSKKKAFWMSLACNETARRPG
jgi:hypothetical protein